MENNFISEEILKQIDNCGCNESGEGSSSDGTQSINPIGLEVCLIAPNISDNPGAMSQLILDSWGDYYLQYKSSSVDGVNAPSMFNNHRNTEIMSAYEQNRAISIILHESIDKSNISDLRAPEENCSDQLCLDTPVGFKLSQVIRNIGDVGQISIDQGVAFELDQEFGQGVIQVLRFTQKAYISEKGDERRLIFKFQITNVSPIYIARRVLFKDILPKGVSLVGDEIYVNGKKVESFKVSKDGRRIFVRLPIINPTEQIVVSLVCSLHKNNCGLTNYNIMNFGALCSIFSNFMSSNYNMQIIKSAVQISNIVVLRDIM